MGAFYKDYDFRQRAEEEEDYYRWDDEVCETVYADDDESSDLIDWDDVMNDWSYQCCAWEQEEFIFGEP